MSSMPMRKLVGKSTEQRLIQIPRGCATQMNTRQLRKHLQQAHGITSTGARQELDRLHLAAA
jgi:hypothetical protein